MDINTCKKNYDEMVDYDVETAAELRQMEIAEAHMIVDFDMKNKWNKTAFENVLMKLPDDYSLSKMDEKFIRFISTKSKKMRKKLAAEFLSEYDKEKNVNK